MVSESSEAGHRVNGGPTSESDRLGPVTSETNRIDAKTQAFAAAQTEILGLRCQTLADRVRAGNLGFIDAVDMGYSAATLSGLVDLVGDDVVQLVLAEAFGTVPRGAK